MSELKARVDWLKELVQAEPTWASIVDMLAPLNPWCAVPGKHSWKDGDTQDTHLTVLEEGVKGPPAAFCIKGDMVLCVNYPGSHGPMTKLAFVQYVQKISSKVISNHWRKQIIELLSK